MPLSSNDVTTHNATPQEIAAIDLGSNSFHMVIARVVNGSMQTLGKVKQRVHLADGLDSKNILSEEAMQRGLDALTLFAERLQGMPSENVAIVGTYTLRQARNADEFLKRAANILQHPIEVISGQEEARLIFMGVEHTQPEKGRKLVIDIGGGSTELIIGEDFQPLLTESRRMGCVSFARRYFADGIISKEAFNKARLRAALRLKNLSFEYKKAGWEYALGASGTIKSIHQVLLDMGEKDGIITPERLEKVIEKTLKAKHTKDLKFEGLSDERRNTFVPGLAILAGVFDVLEIKELRLSNGALREGVLYEMEGRSRHQDVRSRTAASLAEHYNIDAKQAHRVLDTTDQLFAMWHQQNPSWDQPQIFALLHWAAMLYEVGLNINHAAIQRHSAYILENTNLPGFSQEQQLLLATMTRLHRKSIKLGDLPELHMFKKKHYLPMIQILRLAILLNNQRQSTTVPKTLRLLTNGNVWTLIFPKDFLAQNSLLQLDLKKEQVYWENVDDWELFIEEESE